MNGRLSAILLLALLACISGGAVPAFPGTVKYRQPDGSVIDIRLHGDEFYHYTTHGHSVVALDKDGFYRPAAKPEFDVEYINTARRAARSHTLKSAFKRAPVKGRIKIPVFLVEFADLPFTVPNPKASFHDMLNKAGYSDNGATGSVHDYFYENSQGLFDPVFDVIGPIRLEQGYAAYGQNHEKGGRDFYAGNALFEAYEYACNQGLINESDYDIESLPDFFFFIYAGHNEAEGGGEDTIWPHAMSHSNYSYACTSEYRGAEGNSMAGIGTFCHEFGHLLGLPDFYDTNYENDGTAKTVDNYSLMCQGCYNNAGRTPPYLGVLERYMLGWKDSIEQYNESGRKTLRPVYENDGFSTPASADGEYFLYEFRDGTKWDSKITSGGVTGPVALLVYHVDRSNNIVNGRSAASLWTSNDINCYGSHPCYYLKSEILFPASAGARSFEGVDWASVNTGYKLSDISFGTNQVMFLLSVPEERLILGKVCGSSGKPLPGIKVEIAGFSVVTDADGSYELSVPLTVNPPFDILFSADYYLPVKQTIDADKMREVVNVVMYNVIEGYHAALCKHGSTYDLCGISEVDNSSGTFAVGFSESELNAYSGYVFKSINFLIGCAGAGQVDVFINAGSKRIFTRTVESPLFYKMTSVDISDAHISVPVGEVVYFGVAVKDVEGSFWIGLDDEKGTEGGFLFKEGFHTDGPWYGFNDNVIIDADLQQGRPDLFGTKVISSPAGDNPYDIGTVFTCCLDNPEVGDTPQSVNWYYDGVLLNGSSVRLESPGDHTIKAIIKYPDGSTEQIRRQISVR